MIVKVAGDRRKRPRRTAFAYETTDLQGRVILLATASSGASTINAAA